jgi:hypothetical protein
MNKPKRKLASLRAVQSGRSGELACRKVLKSEALNMLEALKVLRRWRTLYPKATRLDGEAPGSKSNPCHWFHIRVDGYDASYEFPSRHGRTFHGRDYNGIVSFHGDTLVRAVDRLIELVDEKGDYHHVLRPWATHETKKKVPRGRRVKPKFALRGHEDQVEGFFLYHDEWK